METPTDDTGVARPVFWTIGHSDHPIDRFVALLRAAEITAVADLRSVPWSRRHPQFGARPLAAALKTAGIAHVPLGAELGGRPPADADPERLAEARARGIARLLHGARHHRIALMCAERDPLDCHRFHLVSPLLRAAGAQLVHLTPDGGAESDGVALERLARSRPAPAAIGDLFGS
ncbi:DUF488 family protein [Tistrella mobilis]|uniref:DUF488 domain-containing protein n=1 Tax=Tistrella mobilis TaxID=171437 RepID=UPI003557AF92